MGLKKKKKKKQTRAVSLAGFDMECGNYHAQPIAGLRGFFSKKLRVVNNNIYLDFIKKLNK